MKKLFIPFAIFILLQNISEAQESSKAKWIVDRELTSVGQKQNSWFFEIGGSSPALSFNYEQFLSRKPGGLSVRAGVGVGAHGSESFTAIPLGASYNLPISKHKNELLEVGGAYTLIHGEHGPSQTGAGNSNLFTPQISYRYQSLKGGFQLRLTVSPYIFSPENDAMKGKHLVGVSLGRRF